MLNEQVIGRSRLHWIVYCFPATVLALGVLLMVWPAEQSLVVARPTGLPGNPAPNAIGGGRLLGGLLFVAGLAYLGRAHLRKITAELAVTNTKIIGTRGWLRRTTVSRNLDALQNLQIEQTLLGRMLGYGTVRVVTTDASNANFRLIADPFQFQSDVHNALEVRKRGP